MYANYIASVLHQYAYYKGLAEKTFAQLPDEALFWQHNEDSNSIAIIVQHMWGNMMSRWTDFLTTDGEKDWRERDAEFEIGVKTRAALLEKWEEGWTCAINALEQLKPEDFDTTVYIRKEAHSVIEAINRQLAHYPYHVGQIVFIGKMLVDGEWKSLSIPRKKK